MSYADILKEHFENAKAKGLHWYEKAARYFLLANLVLYAAGCVIAGGVVGPVRYIEFLYHCSHFDQAAPAGGAAKRDGIVPLAPVPQKPKRAPIYKPESSF